MKQKTIRFYGLALLLMASVCLINACSALKTEMLGAPPAGTVITNASVQYQLPPPVAQQLQAGAQIVSATVPGETGTLIGTMMNLAASALAAFATFHAAKAATSSSAAGATAAAAAAKATALPKA